MTPENLGFNQSACSMDFPEDVVTLILVRLPVKSLLRFQCVCKAWCGLIGSRRFADMHLRHPSQGRENEYLVLKRSELDGLNTVLSFYCRDGDLLKAAAPDWRPAVGMEFIGGPVNGICLFSTLDRTVEGWKHHYFEPQHSLYLCNPATREFRKIPDRPFGRQRARPPTLFGIYANPFDCRRASVGFGYDPLTNDYKIVSIMFFLENRHTYGYASVGPLKIEIYELSSNSWRVADTVFPTDFHPHPDPYYDLPIHPLDLNNDTTGEGGDKFPQFTCGLFFNGCIHWHVVECIRAILAFNVSDEVMRAFNLPRAISMDNGYDPRSLFVLDGSLAFVQGVLGEEDRYRSTATSFYVWVMMEYGNGDSWIKRFYFQPKMHMDVLCCWNDMLICETKEDRELVSCNLQDDAPHQFRNHHHITSQLSNQHRVQQRLYWDQDLILLMHKESLVRLR